ncbi:carbohydrate kinase [Sphingomonas turrisvirgatae]|uniref:Carbohydrate kinase n=2 Tax=Sphingomonas turrisvirgatae TaxID=1888892 RepID=A0A1E3LRI5_9SPHN|nr:adenosine kinase [Sphingomonas turrisvirgatae]ODP36369.1 carbohydrate kinase [Sphingomonas turrisvirgatae]
MQAARFDVLAIGNAIVDVIAHASEAFLSQEGMTKGGMMLIDEGSAQRLYEAMGPGVEVSGGSAGNTIAGVAAFGGSGAFIGKVRNDVLGEIYRHDLSAIGVHFDTPATTEGPATARCLALVTPDAERTMNTFLGACTGLDEGDINPELVASAQITYLEGYLFDQPPAKAAFRKAASLAREAGRKVALTMSDSFCVHRHRDEFLQLVGHHVDILFANEEEILALYGVDDVVEAAKIGARHAELVTVTRGAAGALLVKGDEVIEVPAARVATVVDTTGAGDLYAAGVLYGLSRGLPLAECGRLGCAAAGEVIGHFGARPQADLKLSLAG